MSMYCNEASTHKKSIFHENETAGHENQKIISCKKFKHIGQNLLHEWECLQL